MELIKGLFALVVLYYIFVWPLVKLYQWLAKTNAEEKKIDTYFAAGKEIREQPKKDIEDKDITENLMTKYKRSFS